MQTLCAIAIAGLAAGSVQASVLTYNPSLGTLPTAQGWTFVGSFNAPMSVSGGTLTYGATTVGGTTFWRETVQPPMDFTTQTFSLSARVKLSGADFGNFSGFRRGGFSLYLEDDFGRYIIADMGDNRISLGNDNNRTSDPVATVDLTSEFRTLTLEAGPGGARLLLDGVEQLTLGLGLRNDGDAGASWGEMTGLANVTQTQIQNVTFIPAPGAAAMLSLIALGSCRRRRAN